MDIEQTDVWEQLQEFEHKRALLASLIRVARDLNGHTHALHDVQLLAKPSQSYPKRVHHYKDEIKSAIQQMDETQLTVRSNRYDQQTGILMEAMLAFIELAQDQLANQQTLTEFNQKARLQLDEFQTVSHMAVSLRLLLQDLGVILPPVRFDFPQEWIGEQIEALNGANHTVRVKAIDRIAELVFDTQALLRHKGLPELTLNALSYVQDAMKTNLEYLEHGGNIDELPHEIEELELDTLPAETLSTYLNNQRTETVPESPQTDHEHHDRKQTFNKKLKKWLDTPWATKWRDLD